MISSGYQPPLAKVATQPFDGLARSDCVWLWAPNGRRSSSAFCGVRWPRRHSDSRWALAGSFALHQVLGAYLFGIEPSDIGTYSAAVLLMSAALVAVCAVPAFRASRVDPLTALRHE